MNEILNFLTQRGVTTEEITLLKDIYVLLLLLPIVSTAVAIARYIIGAKSLSIFTPVILTFLFFELGKLNGNQDLARGLKFGLVLFFTLLAGCALFSWVVRKLRMNYIPKLTLVIIGVISTIFLTMFLSLVLGLKGLVNVNQFTLIILVILTEPIFSVMARRSIRYGAISSVYTLITAVVCYVLITVLGLQTFIGNNPIVIVLVVILNVFIGRFTGLRLTEYWRFRDILLQEPQKDSESVSNSSKNTQSTK